MRRELFKGHHYENGSVLVEFVLVLPILITIIFTVIEVGIMLTILVNLQGCIQAGAYYGQAGSYTTGSTRTASAKAIMMQKLWNTLNTANLAVTIQSFPNFATANLGGSGAPDTGSAGQVAMYQMQYSYTPSSPLIAGFFGSPKILTATTYVKNEEAFPP
jgi:Flp pilus assembly protein TadG